MNEMRIPEIQSSRSRTTQLTEDPSRSYPSWVDQEYSRWGKWI